jgi:hypothetical protein
MIKRTLAAAAVLAVVSGPAYAFHCPNDVKAIGAALGKSPYWSSLSSSQVAEVKKLRDEGNGLHNTGRHKAALDALHKAMTILSIKH